MLALMSPLPWAVRPRLLRCVWEPAAGVFRLLELAGFPRYFEIAVPTKSARVLRQTQIHSA